MRVRGLCVAVVCALAGGLVFGGAPAGAVVVHEYLSQISEVPAGPGAPASGPLHELQSMTVDAGHLWIAERYSGLASRIDEFDASTGAFVAQLSQPAGLSKFEGGVAVGPAGHAPGAGVVYAGVRKEPSDEGLVAVFSEAGGLLGTWTGADTPAGSFGEEGISGVAVDGSASLTDWAAGDVYVANWWHEVVDVFKPKAGGGEEYVTQLTGVSPSEPFHELSKVAVSAVNGDVLIVDGNTVDVFAPGALAGEYEFVRKITGTPSGAFTLVYSLAVDGGTGEIYVTDGEAGFGSDAVDEFSAAGVYLGRITGAATPAGSFKQPISVAVDGDTHHVFVGDRRQDEGEVSVVDFFGMDLVIPDVVTEPVTGLGATSVTLNGTVDPDSAGAATCQFVWGTSKTFGEVAACSKPVPDGGSPVPVEAVLSGLQPDTTYYYRLQASNKTAGGGGVNPGEESQDRQFTTPGPGLHGTWSSNVASGSAGSSSGSATLLAAINPHNAPTSYYFQYGPSAGYGTDVPVLAGSAVHGAPVGSGEGDVQVSEHIQGLAPDTTYHYRVVAVGELAPGVFESFAGPDETLTTPAGGEGFALPDGRAWEQVSPVDKYGASIKSINAPGSGLVQASADGGAIAYVASAPTETEGVQGYGEFTRVLSRRGADGWSSRDLTYPRSAHEQASSEFEAYKFFSEDLSVGVLEPRGSFTPLSSWASERTPYLHTQSACEGVTEGECDVPLVTGKEGYADVPEPGTAFGDEGEESQHGFVGFVGATPDASDIVLKSRVALTGTPTDGSSLYEWSAGEPPADRLALVSVLPAGEGGGAAPEAILGFEDKATRHAISNDGSRIFFTSGGTSSYVGHLYMRDVAHGENGETIRLDLVEGRAEPTAYKPTFQAASSDGSRVFFLDESRLTKDAGGRARKPDLYECEIVEVAGKLECKLTDLTPEGGRESAAVIGGLLGVSEDGGFVYFVADGVLAPGAAPGDCINIAVTPPGATCNLYVWHEGVTRFISVLSAEDWDDWGAAPPAGPGTELGGLTARVSPDGRYLAFMSLRSLTGYDNHDVVSDVPDEEVYLYDYASGGGKVVCASCNPSGARPTGAEVGAMPLAMGVDETWRPGTSIAASIPGWTINEVSGQESVYQSRYLSDSGRLFFDSRDALVPQDTNGANDVYEYEPPGVGSCVVGSVTFSERSDGCVGLISSGVSPDESAFLDASATGDDVFFLTSQPLVPGDVDTAYDVYDAHVCSSDSPCVSATESAPVLCATAEACRTATGQPGGFSVPASATFSGAGNLTAPTSPVVAPKAKPKKKIKPKKKHTHKKARKKKGKAGKSSRRVRQGAKGVVKATGIKASGRIGR